MHISYRLVQRNAEAYNYVFPFETDGLGLDPIEHTPTKAVAGTTGYPYTNDPTNWPRQGADIIREPAGSATTRGWESFRP